MGYKKVINILSYLLLIISLYYISGRLFNNYSQLSNWQLSKSAYIVLTICLTAYMFSNFLLSFAWKYLLALSGFRKISHTRCHIIYGRTQISKYIPGNIFHFVGRYFLGKKAGIPNTVLMTSTFNENVGLFVVASVITIISYALNGVSEIGGISLYRISFFSGSSFILGYLGYYHFIRNKLALSAVSTKTNLFSVGICYTAFFVIFATVGVVISLMIAPEAIQGNGYYIFMVFISSWVIGYMTPGAPAGVGVREAVIILLLGPLTGEGECLIIAFLFRFITVAGDLFYFLLSYILAAHINKGENINNPI
jgi:glycosyltransferase 2 family protein